MTKSYHRFARFSTNPTNSKNTRSAFKELNDLSVPNDPNGFTHHRINALTHSPIHSSTPERSRFELAIDPINQINQANEINQRMKITRFEDLECWQEARKLVNMVYDAINSSPAFQRDRRLKDQSTGAAISVMGNIPEGFVRRSNREFIQFLFISVSSAAELQSHRYVALDQHYVTKDIFDGIYQQADKASKMISGLITYLRNNEARFKQKKQEKPKKQN